MAAVDTDDLPSQDGLHPQVREELERVTTTYHGGEGVYEFVDAIETAESPGKWFLGLSPNADRAHFYVHAMSAILSYPYPPRAAKFWDSRKEARGDRSAASSDSSRTASGRGYIHAGAGSFEVI